MDIIGLLTIFPYFVLYLSLGERIQLSKTNKFLFKLLRNDNKNKIKRIQKLLFDLKVFTSEYCEMEKRIRNEINTILNGSSLEYIIFNGCKYNYSIMLMNFNKPKPKIEIYFEYDTYRFELFMDVKYYNKRNRWTVKKCSMDNYIRSIQYKVYLKNFVRYFGIERFISLFHTTVECHDFYIYSIR